MAAMKLRMCWTNQPHTTTGQMEQTKETGKTCGTKMARVVDVPRIQPGGAR